MLSSIAVVNKKEKNKEEKIGEYLSFYIQNHYKGNQKKEIIFLFLGEGSCLANSLAPTIGGNLKEKYPNANILGTLKEPVGIYDLEEKDLNDYLIISIDSLLGQEDEVGNIVIETNSLFPSILVGKTNRIGDIRVGAIIGNKKEVSDLDSLKKINPCVVKDLGKIIQKAIAKFIEEFSLE